MSLDLVLGIAGLVIGILSLAGFQLRLKRVLSWKQVRSACEELLPKLTEYGPDLIIGINDGGVVAGILSTNHQSRRNKSPHFLPFIVLGMAIKRDMSGSKEMSLIGTELIPDLSGKKILVVDNHLYTGATLRHTINFLNTRNPKEIRSLVLFNHEMKQKLIEPDYVGRAFSANRRRVPWSIGHSHYSVYET